MEDFVKNLQSLQINLQQMMTSNNSNPITEIAELIVNLKDKIEKTSNEFNNYLDVMKDEKFIEQLNEKEEDAIRRAESIYDRLDEIVNRNHFVLKNGKETTEFIDNIKLKMESVVESCENDGIHLEKTSNELIDKIIDLEERKMNKHVEPLQQQIDKIKQNFNNKKNDWDNQRLKFKEFRNEQEEKQWKHQPMSQTFDFKEMKQIEEWSGMKIGNIIFDSNVDDWKKETLVFGERVLNKSDLIFLIEDDDGNKFGSYINAKVEKLGDWISDPKSFVFSLKSNGRLNGMFKFEIKEQGDKSIYIGQNKLLFEIGNGDICIYRKNSRTNSYCKQQSFDYDGIENALCGKYNFTPKRIKVIQLI